MQGEEDSISIKLNKKDFMQLDSDKPLNYSEAYKIPCKGLSMPFIGDLCRRLGCKLSIFIGSAIYRLGYYCTINNYINYIFFTYFLMGSKRALHALFCKILNKFLDSTLTWLHNENKLGKG